MVALVDVDDHTKAEILPVAIPLSIHTVVILLTGLKGERQPPASQRVDPTIEKRAAKRGSGLLARIAWGVMQCSGSYMLRLISEEKGR